MLFLRPYREPGSVTVQYRCSLCGKFAVNKSNMRKHMLVMHVRPTHQPCPYCTKVFRNKYYLNYHVKACSHNPEVIAKKSLF